MENVQQGDQLPLKRGQSRSCSRFLLRACRSAGAWRTAFAFPKGMSFLLNLFCGLALLSTSLRADETVLVENALIRLVDEVEVPAREAGALAEILVREGEAVTAGQIVARIENQQQKLQLERARLELMVSHRELENEAPLALAEKAVEIEQQAAAEQKQAGRIAHKKAENEFKVEAATKQRDVAHNELDRALQARKEFEGSISESEIDSRRLTFEHADLNSRQARFEQEIEVLQAEAEDIAARTRALSIEQARLQVDDAHAKHDVAALQVQLKEKQVDLAGDALQRREIHSPIDGTVVRVNRHVGEWMEPGEPCLRIVRLSRLRVEGFVSARFVSRLSPGAKALVTVQTDDSQREKCEGTVTFISPEIDPVNQEIRIWVEIENVQNRFRPGMHGTMTIPLPGD